MKYTAHFFFSCLSAALMFFSSRTMAQGGAGLLDPRDMMYLKGLTAAVLQKARVYPGENNHTGGSLIRPGGNYPSFWIRDYALSLGSGLIGRKEQRHMLWLTAAAQCSQTWITGGGGLVPSGAIADHILPADGLPIYYPGTYSYAEQGAAAWGRVPPYDDQFYFIHMAYYFVKSGAGTGTLRQTIRGISLIDRLELAFRVPPAHADNGIVYTTDEFRGVDFGFRDAEQITGDLCFPSILKYRASRELAELFDLLGDRLRSEKYRRLAKQISAALPRLFADQQGLLRASTGKSRQPDVWGTALAVYYGLLAGRDREAACHALANAYERGWLAFKGNIRHVPIPDDFNDSTAWEFSLAEKNTYQNGAYWGTPVGWVCYAIAQVNKKAARRLAAEYLADLRETDFRQGENFGGPYECFYPPAYKQNPVYLSTVSCPYGVFRKMGE